MAIGTPYVLCEGSQGNGVAASFPLAVATANSAGDYLFAWAVIGSTSSLVAVEDPVNGQWYPWGAGVAIGSGYGQWYVMPNAAVVPTSDDITLICTGSGGARYLLAGGCSGLTTGMPDVAPPGQSYTSGAHPTAASGPLSFASELVLAGGGDANSGGTPAWNSPFTILGSAQHTGTSVYATFAYDVVSSAASVTAEMTITSSNSGLAVISIPVPGDVALQEQAAVLDQVYGPAGDLVAVHNVLAVAAAVPVADETAIADTVAVAASVPDTGYAAITDSLAVAAGVGPGEETAIADSLAVSGQETVADEIAIADTFTASPVVAVTYEPPSPGVPPAGSQAMQYIPRPAPLPPAVPVFTKGTMPRVYLQDLPSGQWLHRDVGNITSPLIGWQLNTPGTFTCTISPPRADLLDATGNPLIQKWKTACYLEQEDSILWGGICTLATPAGPDLPLTFTEMNCYPNGMPYEGPAVSENSIDALDAVRNIWSWLQAQTGGDLGMVLDDVKAGVTLGSDTVTYNPESTLSKAAQPGDTQITAVPLPTSGGSAWTAKSKIQVGSETHTVTGTSAPGVINLATPIQGYQPAGSLVGVPQPTTPYTLDWWNSTDCGQEITSIQQEAPFDFREVHTWADPGKQGVAHRLMLGVPRLGSRRADLRFCEGENIVQPCQFTDDGSVFANNAVGIGAGQGSATVRATAAVADGYIRRTTIYQNQTVTRPDRLSSLTYRALTAANANDTISQFVVKDHPHAPFGSFFVGDDIPVIACTGWRNTLVWSRIIGMQQDPTTSLMTVQAARSDSFTYLPQSGSAGTV